MARHHLQSEPTSRLAIWARRMAAFAFVASFLAVIIVRSGLLEIRPALATFAGALAIAVVAIVLALAAFVVIWTEGLAGVGRRIDGDGGVARAPRLPGLFRTQGVSAALDLRHHHGSDRSAAFRGAGAAARTRRQPHHICRPLCRRTAARRLSGRRSARDQCDRA